MTTEFKESLILEQYKALCSETLSRIKEHHKLWFYKLISCGAILSFVMTTSTPEAKYGSIVVPFLAIFFDALITNNLLLISAMGSFISEFYEQKYQIDGWDTISGKTRYFRVKRTWLTDWLTISMSTIGLFILTAFLLWIMDTIFNLPVLVIMTVALVAIAGHIYITFLQLIKNEQKPDSESKFEEEK